jgi:hypothetical protein
MKRFALIATLSVLPSICLAGFFDGNELLDTFEKCEKGDL